MLATLIDIMKNSRKRRGREISSPTSTKIVKFYVNCNVKFNKLFMIHSIIFLASFFRYIVSQK